MFEILDAILATAAVILGLSLIVQAMQQIIKQVFDLKSSYMKSELLALFTDVGERRRFVVNLVPIGLLSRLADSYSRRVVNELEERMTTFGLTDLHLLQNIDAQKLTELVLSLPVARDVSLQDKLAQALDDIEKWFDLSKKAFQEHYERRMKLWSFIISGSLVIVLNANILDTYTEFTHNKPMRDAAIALGQRLTSVPRDSMIVRFSGPRKDSTSVQSKSDSLILRQVRSNLDSISVILDDRSFQVFGWTAARAKEMDQRTLWNNVIHSGVGWVGMLLLVSLGAPFWYDFFKTVAGLKPNVTKSQPEETS